jgi:hypothetical protein
MGYSIAKACCEEGGINTKIGISTKAGISTRIGIKASFSKNTFRPS